MPSLLVTTYGKHELTNESSDMGAKAAIAIILGNRHFRGAGSDCSNLHRLAYRRIDKAAKRFNIADDRFSNEPERFE